jgi:hypothetical protein
VVALSVNQHELIADGSPTGLLFGTLSTGYLTQTRPSEEPGDVGGSEVPRNREDGVFYGEEYDGAGAVAFDIGVLSPQGSTNPGRDVADAMAEFKSRWRSRQWRVPFNAYAVLSSNMYGRTRRCYGRPRRWAPADETYASKGVASFLCDFSVMDGRWYDDATTTVTTPAGSQSGGSRIATITVGGTEDAWPVVTISAGSVPLIRPTLVLGPLSMTLQNLTIAAGQTFTIDPQPWSRQFVKNGNRATPTGDISPAGASTLLRDFRLPVGTHQLTLTADTLAAGATASVSWRNAWSRW